MDPQLTNGVLLAHTAATWYMVGLIWFVQVVHYPLFGGVGQAESVQYAADHQRLTTFVVAPPMLIELVTAALLLAVRPANVPASWAWAGMAMLAIVWLSTALLQIPRHNELSAGYNAPAHAALVATNWVRTIAWSARGVLALGMVYRAMPG